MKAARFTMPVEYKILLSFCFGLAVLLAVSTISYQNSQAFLAADTRSDRINATLRALDQMLFTFVDAETGQRGYVITGATEYLEPYNAALRRVDSNLRQVKALFADELSHQADITQLEALGNYELVEIKQTIGTRERDGFGAAQAVVLGNAGKRDMDRIRVIIERLSAAKQDELAEVQELLKKRARYAVVSIAALALVVFLAFGGAYLVIFKDLQDKQALTRRLEHAANHDSLTNLPNRALLKDLLSTCLAQAKSENTSVAVLFIDLDGFKEVNDRFGHRAGDDVLMEVARRFKETVRDAGMVSRLGGDEFAVLTSSIATNEDLAALAQRLIDALKEPLPPPLHHIALSASAGIAIYPNDGQNPLELLKSADLAMYEAKSAGKSGFRFARGLPDQA